MKTVSLSCDVCGADFERRQAEHNRCLRLGRKVNCCSRKCAGQWAKDNVFSEQWGKHNHNLKVGGRHNYKGPYTELLRRCKQRKKDYDLDQDYIDSIWKLQEGKCAYTGIKLRLPNYKDKNDKRYLASIDRIDSTRGYVKDNVHIVSSLINCAKNNITHSEMLEFITEIKGVSNGESKSNNKENPC